MRRRSPEPGSPADWLRHARSDLIIAAKAAGPGVLRETLCFHCQQAAEKAVKAVLVLRQVEFPYTHNLARLISLAQESNLGWPEELSEAAGLTRYAAELRYPGPSVEVTEEQYRLALRLAKDVVAWAASAVKSA